MSKIEYPFQKTNINYKKLNYNISIFCFIFITIKSTIYNEGSWGRTWTLEKEKEREGSKTNRRLIIITGW